jgi:hypothetical protein
MTTLVFTEVDAWVSPEFLAGIAMEHGLDPSSKVVFFQRMVRHIMLFLNRASAFTQSLLHFDRVVIEADFIYAWAG